MQIRPQSLLLVGALLGMGLGAAPARAVDQAPTAFPITIDGRFTNASEWSDVTPIVFNAPDGAAFTYTCINQGKSAIVLMYDDPGSTVDFMGALSGPVEFNIGQIPATQEHFQVYFTSTGINVWRSVGSGNPAPFSVAGSPPLMVGRRFRGTSPNSGAIHNMHELSVLVNCQDPSLNCMEAAKAGLGGSALLSHGLYSPDPAHWGAAISNGPVPEHCVIPATQCNQGVPTTVPCNTPGAVSIIGNPVSNACVDILDGTGGTTRVTKIPLPGESQAVPAVTPWGIFATMAALLLIAGATLVLRRRHSSGGLQR